MKENIDLYNFFRDKKYSWWDLLEKASLSQTFEETLFYLHLADSPLIESPFNSSFKLLNKNTFTRCNKCPMWITQDGEDRNIFGICILTGYETRKDGDCGNYKCKDMEEDYCGEEILPLNREKIIYIVSNM